MRKEDNREKYKEYDHRYYIKHKRPNSKIGKLETKISDLEAKLAGKDQAIESLEELNRSLGQTCNNDRKEIERLRELISDKEKEIANLKGLVRERDKQIKNIKTNKKRVIEHKNKTKINFAIEQLEKVKEKALHFYVNDTPKLTGFYIDINEIDNQIKQLKEIK